MSITSAGGVIKRGGGFSFSYAPGGLTGVQYVSLISPTFGVVACTSVNILTDTTGTAVAPTSGLLHDEILTMAFA